jgi:hypothetical protein
MPLWLAFPPTSASNACNDATLALDRNRASVMLGRSSPPRGSRGDSCPVRVAQGRFSAWLAGWFRYHVAPLKSQEPRGTPFPRGLRLRYRRGRRGRVGGKYLNPINNTSGLGALRSLQEPGHRLPDTWLGQIRKAQRHEAERNPQAQVERSRHEVQRCIRHRQQVQSEGGALWASRQV